MTRRLDIPAVVHLRFGGPDTLLLCALALLDEPNSVQMCQVWSSEHKLHLPQSREFAEAMVNETLWVSCAPLMTLGLDSTVECHERRRPGREPRDRFAKQLSYDRRLMNASMSAPKPSAMW